MGRSKITLIGAILLLGACASLPAETAGDPPQPETTSGDQARPVTGAAPVGVPVPVGAVEDFGMLAALAGTRWRGVPVEAEGVEGNFVDITEWYWDLGGTVLVNRHTLEDGSYGGITYVQKNAESGALDYVYITSGGFRTMGQFTLDEAGNWSAYEAVEGMDDITAVRSSGTIDPEDGTMYIESEYETLSGWVAGRAMVYSPYEGPLPDLAPIIE